MAVLDGIKVRVMLMKSGRFLEEFDSSKVPAVNGPLQKEKCIQATSGAQLGIVVQLSSNYKFFSANGLSIGYKIDDDSLIDSHYGLRRHDFNKDLEGTKSYTFHEGTIREGDNCKRIEFAFGAVEINEELDFEDEIIKDHAKNQGIIRVRICRARIRQSKRPHDTYESEEVRVRLAEAPKRLVKDNHISHTMKPTNEILLRPSSSTPKRGIKSTRLPGDEGNIYEFVFRYRSNRLHLLGCNPVDETEEGEHEHRLKTESLDIKEAGVKRESLVEPEPSVKLEPGVTPEIGSERMKLKRSEDDGDNEIRKLEVSDPRFRISRLHLI